MFSRCMCKDGNDASAANQPVQVFMLKYSLLNLLCPKNAGSAGILVFSKRPQSVLNPTQLKFYFSLWEEVGSDILS